MWEQCDGDNLSGESCDTLGYYSGSLSCNSYCNFDTSLCEGRCNDGIIQEEEVCDGTNLGTLTCEGLGYYGGTVACTHDCQPETSDCETYGWCGDGVIQAGEVCDSTDLGATTCDTLGFPHGGTPTCLPDCTVSEAGCRTYAHVSAGHLLTCAITQAGETYCFGINDDGQLGAGIADVNSTYPVLVAGGHSFASFPSGSDGDSMCALENTSDYYCWGNNYAGQLGDGSTQNSNVPVAVNQGYAFTHFARGAPIAAP